MINHHRVPNKGEPVTMCGIYLSRAAARGIYVPTWVPRRLIAEYVDCACEYGEEHAASHVRKVKQELQINE